RPGERVAGVGGVRVVRREHVGEEAGHDQDDEERQRGDAGGVLQQAAEQRGVCRLFQGVDVGDGTGGEGRGSHYRIRTFGLSQPCNRSTMRLTMTTMMAVASTSPITSGMSPWPVAPTATWPRPGMAKIFSTITAPPSRPTNCRPRTDRAGPAALRSTCLPTTRRSEEHTSELQSHLNLVSRLLLEKKKRNGKKR